MCHSNVTDCTLNPKDQSPNKGRVHSNDTPAQLGEWPKTALFLRHSLQVRKSNTLVRQSGVARAVSVLREDLRFTQARRRGCMLGKLGT